MKDLQDLLKESMEEINETRAEKFDAYALSLMLLDPQDRNYEDPEDLQDIGWSEEMIEYFKQHCCIVPALGGFSGNVQDDWTEFSMGDVMRKKVIRPNENAKVKQILKNPIVKKYLKFEPKLVGFRGISGFDCPAIVCFDEDTPMAKRILLLADESL